MANNRRPPAQPTKAEPPQPRILPESPLKEERCSVVGRPHEFVLLRTDGIPAHEEVNPLSGQRFFVPPQPQWDTFYCRFCLEYLRRPASGTLGAPTAAARDGQGNSNGNGNGILVPFQRNQPTPPSSDADTEKETNDAPLSAPEGRDYPGGAGA